MEKKELLLASFVYKDRLDNFLMYLEGKFGIHRDNVFVYEVEDNELSYMLTFKVKVPFGERLDIKRHFKATFPVHVKCGTVYTINALNMLIEKLYDLGSGNINYSSYEIDWENYKGHSITVSNNALKITPIKRVFID